MPNDIEQKRNPDEGSEEEKYSFLQETIKPKPISRQQLLKQLIRTAVYGVILGVFACLGFFALKPWASKWFQEDAQTVTIPEDEEIPEDTENVAEEPEEVMPSLSIENYEELMTSIGTVADTAGRSVVSVEADSAQEDWNAEVTGISKSVSGLIAADNGQELLILADCAICDDAAGWKVNFNDGRSYTADLKKQDRNSGFAVFSVKISVLADSTLDNTDIAVLGNSKVVSDGDPVIAMGNIFGYADGSGYGIVSSKEYKASFFDGECDVIATDIPRQAEGTGVLFNLSGEVIGMISSSVWSGTSDETVNAYAISDLKAIIEMLANGESVPYIGIYGTTVTAELEESAGMPKGVYVVDVDTDSPAMAAGIQCGDIICRISDENITSMSTYQRSLLETKKGSQIRITGKRLGADGYVDVNFTVTIGSKE